MPCMWALVAVAMVRSHDKARPHGQCICHYIQYRGTQSEPSDKAGAGGWGHLTSTGAATRSLTLRAQRSHCTCPSQACTMSVCPRPAPRVSFPGLPCGLHSPTAPAAPPLQTSLSLCPHTCSLPCAGIQALQPLRRCPLSGSFPRCRWVTAPFLCLSFPGCPSQDRRARAAPRGLARALPFSHSLTTSIPSLAPGPERPSSLCLEQ